jgi:glycosyltransferase involved in cell wall biosynthesis
LEKYLHIICFTVPFPVDYGGVVDLFWKLPALQQQGIKIHLHCFDYGRGEQSELNKYCASVTYYKRSNNLASLMSSLPFIVATRNSKDSLNNLLKDEYPILCEGVHSTFLLNDKRFDRRKIVLRLHNVENEYYQHLFASTTNFLKKLFYARESNLLKKYEAFIANKATNILTVTEQDAINYQRNFDCRNAAHLPLFLPNNWVVNAKEGLGNYCLYNGDLSVDANAKAVDWLLKNVVGKLENITFVIAGKNPTNKLIENITNYKNVELIANPSPSKMEGLIANAQINILPSFSGAGIKLKLLNALYNGRHCIANNETLSGSGLDSLCFVANTPKEFIEQINAQFEISFSDEVLEQRKLTLTKKFNNLANAELLVKYLYN